MYEGIYTDCIKDIPSKYKNHKNILKCGSEPDIRINKEAGMKDLAREDVMSKLLSWSEKPDHCLYLAIWLDRAFF